MKARELNFATLSSPLARSQAESVIKLMGDYVPEVTCHLDILPSPATAAQNESSVFVSLSHAEVTYLERLVLAETASLICVEAADVQMPLPAGLSVVCVLPRATPFDAYLNRQGLIMDEMDPGARVGVMSMRSRCQMAALWPDLEFQILPGGVDSAMEAHLRRTEIDGLVIPASATENLGIQGIVAEIFAPDFMLPSPGQGILLLIGRTEDRDLISLLADLHSPDTAVEMSAERSFCSRMVTDQDLPVGALSRVEDGQIHITGGTGACRNRIVVTGGADEAEAVGLGLAQQILSSGDSLADLLEAEFPEGLPESAEDSDDSDTVDEDAAILSDLDHDESPDDNLDLDDLEHLRALEDMAGIGSEAQTEAEEDDEDESYD